MNKETRCPDCGSTKLQKAGKIMQRSGEKQRLKCTECAHVFYEEKGVR